LVFTGDDRWRLLPVPEGNLYEWDPESTYVQEPPFFQGMSEQPEPVKNSHEARVLVMVDDSITTDHISPAGNFSATSPAGKYLIEHGVERREGKLEAGALTEGSRPLPVSEHGTERPPVPREDRYPLRVGGRSRNGPCLTPWAILSSRALSSGAESL